MKLMTLINDVGNYFIKSKSFDDTITKSSVDIELLRREAESFLDNINHSLAKTPLQASRSNEIDNILQRMDNISNGIKEHFNVDTTDTKSIIEILKDGVINTLEDNTIISANPATYAMFNYKKDELIGKNINVLFTQIKPDCKNYNDTGIKSSGNTFPISISIASHSVGNINYNYFIVRDETETIKQSEYIKFLSSILDLSSDSIIITDRNLDILFVNKEFQSRTGYSYSEIVTESSFYLKSEHASLPSSYEILFNQVNKRRSWQGKIINRNKDGSMIKEYTTVIPIFSGKTDIPMYFISINKIMGKNITEHQLALNIEYED